MCVLPAAAVAFTLMTYNVEYDNADLPATIEAIAKADADVVVLQEITQRWQDALARLPYAHKEFHLDRRSAGGLAILSKLPIKSRERYDSPLGWFPAERMVITAPWGDVQLLNVHLRPAIDNGSWVRGFVTTPPLRLQEIKAYWPHVDRAMPTIIAGDFNEATYGDSVRFLEQQGLVLAPAVGKPTWHYQDVISFDLDHVMLRGLSASNGRVLDAGTSDHRPVVVTISP